MRINWLTFEKPNKQGEILFTMQVKFFSMNQQRDVYEPVRLTVNGRELTALISSPHLLNFLAAGFLRPQARHRCAGRS